MGETRKPMRNPSSCVTMRSACRRGEEQMEGENAERKAGGKTSRVELFTERL